MNLLELIFLILSGILFVAFAAAYFNRKTWDFTMKWMRKLWWIYPLVFVALITYIAIDSIIHPMTNAEFLNYLDNHWPWSWFK